MGLRTAIQSSIASLTFAAAIAAPASAALVTTDLIDFENPDVAVSTDVGSSFTTTSAEGTDFNFVAPNGFFLVESDAFLYTGSQSLLPSSNSDTVTMTTVNNNPFSLTTIDFGETAGLTISDITISGTSVGGDFFSETYTTDGTLGLETIDLGIVGSAFANFNFDSINLTAGPLNEGYQLDNIGVSVPEPQSVLLFLTVLVTCHAGRFPRRKQA